MKIEYESVPEMSLEEFAEKHDLIMQIRERKAMLDSQMLYYASFKNAETKEGSCLCGSSGDGNTHKEAIEDYAKQIQFKTLIINAYKDSRREVEVPRLFVKGEYR